MNGVVFLDKPAGITSFKAVQAVRRNLSVKKAGHIGTLDPMATGVLPILIGGATRFAEFFPTERKEYSAVMKIGFRTDTLDITGKVTETCTDCTVDFCDVTEAANKYIGEISQIPPMYSALSKDGVKLYKLAREGRTVEREKRTVNISSVKISKTEKADEYGIDVICSGGTYIRTLIDDIGNDLGCFACMTSLRRTFSGGVSIDDCVELQNIKEDSIHPVDLLLEAYPKVSVTASQSIRFSNGGELSLDRIDICKASELYRVYSDSNLFLGMGFRDDEGKCLRVKKRMNYDD